MRTGLVVQRHWSDAEGRPEGGTTYGPGFAIGWQRGPLGRHADQCTEGQCAPKCTRVPQNGAFVEDVIAAAIGRIEHYQQSQFACADNAEALDHLYRALEALNRRTMQREQRKVEGTHAV